MKREIIKKAWVLNSINLEKPYFHDTDTVYYGTRGAAKLSAVPYNDAGKTLKGDDVCFLNIKVRRRPEEDIIRYKGVSMPRRVMNQDIEELNRNESLLKHKEEFFYIQDKRSYVGNSVLWWAKDSKGYCCHLPDAHLYTKEEVLKGFPWRDTDIIHPVSSVIKAVRKHVDMQYLKPENSI